MPTLACYKGYQLQYNEEMPPLLWFCGPACSGRLFVYIIIWCLIRHS